MRILVIGTGGVGSAFAAIAQRRSFFDRITLADLDPSRPQAVVDRLGEHDRFNAARVDASSEDSILALIRDVKADVVLNATDPRFNPQIFDACLQARVTYLDMAATLSQPHPEHPYSETHVKLGDYQFAQHENWRQAGLLALIGIGIEPGAADVFARHAADELFSEIDEVGIRDGANLVVEGYEFAPTFSIWTTIEECLNPPVIWEKGRGWFTTEPFSEPETFDFPEGIGPVECVNVEHEEVLLVPRWIDCKRVTFKYGLGDEFIGILKTLHKLGLDSTQKVRVRDVEVAPRDVIAAMLPDPTTLGDRMIGQDVRRHARHRARQGRQAAEDLPLPRRRQRVVDAGVRVAGRRLADRAEPGLRARAARRGRVERRRGARSGGVPGPAVPRQAGRVRLAARGARARAVAQAPTRRCRCRRPCRR